MSQEAIVAAEAYEALHVPALFGQWVGRVLDAASVVPGHRVLDVACGTGVLAREAAARVGSDGFVAGLDPDPGMLTVAGRLAPTVEWREGVAATLPWPDGHFDAVLCQFGLMFFPDRLSALREMRRVAAPGSVVAVVVWDALENAGAYPLVVELLARHGGPHAADALRVPFVLGDPDEPVGLMETAGLHAVTAETARGTARFPSVRSLVEAEVRGWLPLMGVVLEERTIRRILEEAELALADFVTADGRAVFEVRAHIVRGRKP